MDMIIDIFDFFEMIFLQKPFGICQFIQGLLVENFLVYHASKYHYNY